MRFRRRRRGKRAPNERNLERRTDRGASLEQLHAASAPLRMRRARLAQ